MTNQNHFLPDSEELRKLIEGAGLAKPKVQWAPPKEEPVRFGPSPQALGQQQTASPDNSVEALLTSEPKGQVTQQLDAVLDSADQAGAATPTHGSSATAIPKELKPDARPGIVTMRLDALMAAAAVGPKLEKTPSPQTHSEKDAAEPDPVAFETPRPSPDETTPISAETVEEKPHGGHKFNQPESSPSAKPAGTLKTDVSGHEAPLADLADPLDIDHVEEPIPDTAEQESLLSEVMVDFDPQALPDETQSLFDYLLKDCLRVSQSVAGFLSDTDGLILAKLDVPDSLVGLSAILRNSWHQIEPYLHKPSVPSISIPIGGSQTLHLLWFSTSLGSMIAGLIVSSPIQPIQIIDLRKRCLKTILGFLERTNEH